MLDLEDDRRHPRKRKRPFASGQLPLITGIVLAPWMAAMALAGAWMLSQWFALTLAAYYMLALSYSFKLKRVVMLDVLVLAALYTLRIIADRKSTRLNSSHPSISYAVFCLKKKTEPTRRRYSRISRQHLPSRLVLGSHSSPLAPLSAASTSHFTRPAAPVERQRRAL